MFVLLWLVLGRLGMANWEFDDYGDYDNSIEVFLDEERRLKPSKAFDKIAAKSDLLADNVKADNVLAKAAASANSAEMRNFKKELGAVKVSNDDRLKAAYQVINNPEKHGKVTLEKAIGTVNAIKREQATLYPSHGQSSAEFRFEHGVGKVDLTTGGDASHGKLTLKRDNGYTKKAPGRATLKGVQFSYEKNNYINEIEKQFRREVDLTAVISSEFFKDKSVTGLGKSQLFKKASHIIQVNRNMYLSYLSGLGAVLNNPNLPMDGSGQFNIMAKMDNGLKNYEASTQTNWKPLSPKTIKKKQETGAALTYWKHTGRLSRDYQRNLKTHLSSIHDSDFYDAKKLERTISNFKTQPNARRTPVTYRLDLAIPTWRGPHKDVMDDLVSIPFLYGKINKISHHFKTNQKNLDEFHNKLEPSIMQGTEDRPRDARYEANPEIKQRHKENRLDHSGTRGRSLNTHTPEHHAFDKAFDEKNKPNITMHDVRNAFYNINRVGSGYDRGVRRFLNPEFRRPFVGRLSSAAGKVTRKAILDLIEKG